MAIHQVGLTRPASVRISRLVPFRGVREVRGEVPVPGDDGELSFDDARVDCQLGADPKSGEVCRACPRLIGWRRGPTPGEVTVSCAWTHTDPVSARMTALQALLMVEPDGACSEARALACREGVHRLLVTKRGRLVGVVCGCDLDAGARAGATVGSVMTREVFVIDASAVLGEAAAAMGVLNFGCLPVVRDGWLVGIITRGDLRRAGLSATAP
jgi:hypothetical protein